MSNLAQNRAHTTILRFAAEPNPTCPACSAGGVDTAERYCPSCGRWTGDSLGRLALVLSRIDARWTEFVMSLAAVMVARGEIAAAAERLDVLLTPLPELDVAVERLRGAAVAILLAADYHPFDGPPGAASGG